MAQDFNQFKTLFKYLAFIISQGTIKVGKILAKDTTTTINEIGSAKNVEQWSFWETEEWGKVIYGINNFENFTKKVPKVILNGSNGTGKTTWLMARAKKFADDGKKVQYILLTFGGHKSFLYYQMKTELDKCEIHLDCKDTNDPDIVSDPKLQDCDVILIDEGLGNFFSSQFFREIDNLQENAKAPKIIYIAAGCDPDHLNHLSLDKWTIIPLTLSLRNAKNIGEYIIDHIRKLKEHRNKDSYLLLKNHMNQYLTTVDIMPDGEDILTTDGEA